MLEGTEFERAAIVSFDLSTEWKTYRQLLIKQPKDDISRQLKELHTNDMLIALFPNLHKLGNHKLVYSHFYSISGTNFLRHEIIKNRLRNRFTELSLSNLMKIVIEFPPKIH